MFENIVGQNSIHILQHEITNNTLPPALLLAGPQASGKLTAALELARILSCRNDAAWSCTCQSCMKQKELTAPDILIIGARNTVLEIKAAAQAFLTAQTMPARYLFIRSVRKLTIRFDSRLWDSDEARFSKAIPLLTNLEEVFSEFLALYHVSSIEEESAKREKRIEKIVAVCEKLQEECMYDTIPVNQVRKAASWLHLVPTERKKVLIIEQADAMQDSARNAFLKILEEPPEYAHLILTSSRRRAIIPTILSRVRTYVFTERSTDEQRAVIERVFRDTAFCAAHAEDMPICVLSYLRHFLPITEQTAKETAALFWEYVFMRMHQEEKKVPQALFNTVSTYRRLNPLQAAQPTQAAHSMQSMQIEHNLSGIVKRMNNGKPRSVYTMFLEQLTAFLQTSLRDTACTVHEIEHYAAYSQHVHHALHSLDTLNASAQAVLENLSEQIVNT